LTRDLPYSTQWIVEEDIREVVETLRSPWLTQGPRVEAFEAALAERCDVAHAIAVSSGTAALHLTCLALGLGPGQTLVTSPLSFVASANCAVYCGATPDFADVDPSTGNMTAAGLKQALARGPAHVVMPVHFGGRPLDVESLASVAGRAVIIEDASHAVGAEIETSRGWTRVGSCRHSKATVFSFHPVKPLTTGEGGAVLTSDSGLAQRIRALRSHGIVKEEGQQKQIGRWYYEMRDLGYNYRMTDFQAALGLSQLSRLEEGIKRRRQLASLYAGELKGLTGIRLPPPEAGVRSAWHLYPVLVVGARLGRREVYDGLRAAGILAQVHYIPIHLQPFYRERFSFAKGQFPSAEAFYEAEISLPLFATMRKADVVRVAEALRQILE